MKVLFIVLSGGQGNRLKPVTLFRQKTLLPAMNGRRIIDYAVECGEVQEIPGVEAKTVVLARYKYQQVERYIQKRHPSVSVLVESKPLDTGGAILQHWQAICEYAPDLVVILNGDHLVRLPLQDVIRYYNESGVPALLMIGIQSDAAHHDYINVRFISEKLFHSFHHRKSRVAYTGISLLRFDALKERMDALPMGSYNLTRDIVEWIYRRHGGNYFLLENEWNDLGTWMRYLGFLLQTAKRSV